MPCVVFTPLLQLLGPNFGDLMVDGAFVDWGAYSADHAYSYTGSLSYTITFVGS